MSELADMGGRRTALLVLATGWVLTGIFAFVMPEAFFGVVPGLGLMGPFNLHLVRDVGLAFLAGGLLTGLGTWRNDRVLATAGTLWPVLHGLFHIEVWAHRGFPFDQIFLFDLLAVSVPAFSAMGLATGLMKQERV